jgi:hypothetical protein
MKTCFKCQRNLPLKAFYRHQTMADGHLNKCKKCTKADNRKHRLENAEKYKAYDRARATAPQRVAARSAYAATPRGKEVKARAIANYRARHPQKYAANNAVNNAIRDGRLERKSCEVCGAKAQAHHDDYSKPLDVKWLCQRHHRDRHRQLKAAR